MSNRTCYNCFSEIPEDDKFCPNCGFDGTPNNEKFPHALPEGTVVGGKYILGRVLGQGGFGITYVAKDYQTGELVAIKEYFPESMAARTQTKTVATYSGNKVEDFNYGKECFLHEAKTLAEFIGNSNIVKIYSFFEENDTAYFAMEYVDGISFKDYVKSKGGKVTWQQATDILYPIMDALSAVHAKGIVHRDVSPDNIIITKDGDIKLLDFGAARYSIGDKSRSLDVVLKHGYAPKEQYTRHGKQGPFTDIYSICATFYSSLTGRIPPDSIDRMEEDNLVPPSTLGSDIPEYAEDALLMGMAVQPGDRFQDISALKNALIGSGSAQVNPVQPVIPATPVAPVQPVQPAKPADKGKKKTIIAIAIVAICVIIASIVAVVVIVSKNSDSDAQNSAVQEENEAPHSGSIKDYVYKNKYFDIQFELPDKFDYLDADGISKTFDADETTDDGVPYIESKNGAQYFEAVAQSNDKATQIVLMYDVSKARTVEDYLDKYINNYTVESSTDTYNVTLGSNDFLACDATVKDGDKLKNKTVYVALYDDSVFVVEITCDADSSIPTYAYEYYVSSVGGHEELTVNTSASQVYGIMSGHTYTNDYFGVKYTVPDEYEVLSNSEIYDKYSEDGVKKESDGIVYQEYSDALVYYDSFVVTMGEGDNYNISILSKSIDISDDNQTIDKLAEAYNEGDKSSTDNEYTSDLFVSNLAGRDWYTYIFWTNDDKAYICYFTKGTNEKGLMVSIFVRYPENTSVNSLKQYFKAG